MTALRWHALESSPESYNAWSSALGLDTTTHSFQEVWGLDAELLAFVSQPVKAVIVLFPVTESYEVWRKAADEVKGGEVESILWFRQTIGNACGAMALLHALGNAGVPLKDGTLKTLFAACRGKTTEEKTALLESNEEIHRVHTATAQSGQSALPDLEAKINLHFSSFVEFKGQLIELDGRRVGPINHGPIRAGLLEDAAEVVREMATVSDSIEFSLVTLSPTPSES